MEIKFKSNAKKVQKKIDRAFRKFPKFMDLATKNAAQLVSKDIKQVTPIRHGMLQKSIRPGKLEIGNYEIKARNKNAPAGNPERYVEYVEGGWDGVSGLGQTNQRNKKASRSENGAYKMFEKNEKRAEKHLRVHLRAMVNKIKREIG